MQYCAAGKKSGVYCTEYSLQRTPNLSAAVRRHSTSLAHHYPHPANGVLVQCLLSLSEAVLGGCHRYPEDVEPSGKLL